MTQDSLPVGRKADVGSATAVPSPGTPRPLRLSHPTHTMVTWLLVGVGYALIGGSLRRLTAPAEVATLLPGAGLVWYAQRPATPRFPAPDHLDRRGTLVWGTVAVAFGIWELYAALRGSTPAHPTVSILMGPLLDPPFARAAGYAVWLAAGVWVVRR